MNLESVESVIHWLSGLLASAMLGVILYGIWRGTRRRARLVTGQLGGYLRSSWFYLVTSALYFGICLLVWISLPLALQQKSRSSWVISLFNRFPTIVLAHKRLSVCCGTTGERF